MKLDLGTSQRTIKAAGESERVALGRLDFGLNSGSEGITKEIHLRDLCTTALEDR
jgi:hypothetical protein